MGFLFRFPHPRHFRIGVGNGRNGFGLKGTVFAPDDFRRHVAFVHALVGQHRLTDDISDGVNMRHIGPQPGIHGNVAVIVHLHPSLAGVDQRTIGRSADCDQDSIVFLGGNRTVLGFKRHPQAAVASLHSRHFSLESALVNLSGRAREHLDHIRVCRRDHLIEHFHNLHLRAQCLINHAHLQANNASAHQEQSLGNFLQLQGIGGIPNPRIFMRDKGQFNRPRADRDDGVLKLNRGDAFVSLHLQ